MDNTTRKAYPRRSVVTFEMDKDFLVEFVRDRRVSPSNLIGSIGSVFNVSRDPLLVLLMLPTEYLVHAVSAYMSTGSGLTGRG